ncbi:ABC transporter [Apiospora arundinis]
MTTRNASETKTRRRFIENDCRLEFQQGIEPGKWPEHHKVTFQHIEELGSTHFGEWKAEIQADWRKYPWRLDTRRRAEEIVEKAKQCQRERKNEREWRSEIEPLVFTRLAKDVSWGEPGLSSMFTYREEEIVKHDLAAAAKLKKKSEKPDRVYGLRQTGTLLKLLRTKVGDDEFGTLEERLEPTLFPNDLKPQVFPFLLLEAKTGSSASFQEIDDQSGVMLHKCLTIQQRLRDAISPASKWIAGPLCWYISSCGATWRIAAGYAVDSSRIDFEVANLWVGYIGKDDGALQLLLIADYICDWARSVHREAMIRSLNKLATCPSPELNDLASLRSFDRLTVNSYHGKRDLDILETFAENASESNLLKKLEKISSWESGGGDDAS